MELFFARLISSDNPPTDFASAVTKFIAWKNTHGDKRKVDQSVVVTTLRTMHSAMCETPGMIAIVEEWISNRDKGADCPSLRIPLLARESGMYVTTMSRATDAERQTMAIFDKIFAALLEAEHFSSDALALALQVCFALHLAGFESAIAFALMTALRRQPNDDARRDILDMTEKHAFETREIEIMSCITVTKTSPADLNVPPQQKTETAVSQNAAPAPQIEIK
jgi:hypothetical protein